MGDLEHTKNILTQIFGAVGMRDELKTYWADKCAKPVFLVTTICLLLGTVFYLISGYRSAFPNGILPAPVENLPPKTLSYELLNRSKDEDEIHHTLFKITITNPAGNTDPVSLMQFSLPTEGIECERGSEEVSAEIGVGVATTTRSFLIDCQSREKILDNGNLFSIVN